MNNREGCERGSGISVLVVRHDDDDDDDEIHFIHISKVKLATVVEGDQKASFSIATTPICKGGTTPFP